MREYLDAYPDAGTIEFEKSSKFSLQKEELPVFFSSHDFISQHSNFIALLNLGRVWGINGAVIGDHDYFISDVSREFNKGLNIEHSVYYTIKQVKGKLLNGITAVFGTAGANVYYHWMLDILPRLGLVSKMFSLKSIDFFVTEFTHLPFQEETLEKLGIPTQKIVAANNNWGFHITAETLLVPSLAGPLNQPDFFQVNFLKKLYEDCISVNQPYRKLYISRKKIGRREIVNEAELIVCLSRYNFEIIHCEEMKVAEQVNLFSEASIIICSHGSALTNLVFCKPHTIVVDIFNPSHINPCFWFISKMVNLDYHYILGKSSAIDINPKNDNTEVDMIAFKKKCKSIGLM